MRCRHCGLPIEFSERKDAWMHPHPDSRKQYSYFHCACVSDEYFENDPIAEPDMEWVRRDLLEMERQLA